MIEWSSLISYSITNGIRFFVCFVITAISLKLPATKNEKSMVWLSLIDGMVTSTLNQFSVSPIFVFAFEMFGVILILYQKYKANIRKCIFLTFFVEIAVALWDFLITIGFEIMFRYSTIAGAINYIGIWTVRVFMLGITLFAVNKKDNARKTLDRIGSAIAVVGFLGTIFLTEQTVITLKNDELESWIIFSFIFLMAIIFYKVNRQYEMEKEIASLKTDKYALLERDYQTLNNTYAANAKLYHDFHNHLETLRRYLIDGNPEEALHYIDDLSSPLQTITQTVWTGDKAIDYLINSKLTIAESHHIQVNANIEFPRHTNIRSADLVAILGNLIDNALEAAVNAEDNLRFINLTIRRINDMLIVKVENGCKNAPKQIGGILQTTKDNQAFHGWGLKSVQSAAERYDGTVVTEYEDHIFKAVVTLSYEAVKIDN